jgi:catechol 2,3-dioxygenase-like lactoylglutathione lyase family enzyme
VVDAVRHGMRNREIARRRGVSLDAVKFHVANAVRKLGLNRRDDLRTWRGVPADSAVRERGGPGMSVQLGAIGQVARLVSDIGAATEFYGGVLGLPHLYTFGDLAFFDCGGTRLFLRAAEERGEQSILYFRVDDVTAAYDDLRSRGVQFEGAPHLIHKHDDGVEEWMAFFPDPDGQLLAIMAQVVPSGG